MANLIGPLLGGSADGRVRLAGPTGGRWSHWRWPRPGECRVISRRSFMRSARGDAWSILNRTVVSAALVAGLTFAVMIGTFYLAEQYLQEAVGYSALGASAVLVVVALLVGAAAPLAGGLVDSRGERTADDPWVSRCRPGDGDPCDPGHLPAWHRHRIRADPDRARARDAVRAGVASSAQRHPRFFARTYVRGSLGGAADRCRARRWARRSRAVRWSHRFLPCTQLWRSRLGRACCWDLPLASQFGRGPQVHGMA